MPWAVYVYVIRDENARQTDRQTDALTLRESTGDKVESPVEIGKKVSMLPHTEEGRRDGGREEHRSALAKAPALN